MKQYTTCWLQKLVLLTSFCLVAGCGSPKIDQSAINRLENGVSSYKKIVLDLQNAGLSEEQFQKNWNDANFALRDAISFLEAQKMQTSEFNPVLLNQTADRWVDYLTAFQFPSNQNWISAITRSTMNGADQLGWDKPFPSVIAKCMSMPHLLRTVRYFPQLTLRYYNMEQFERSGINPALPESIQKEITAYAPSDNEPVSFLRHFESYCQAQSYGFKSYKDEYTAEFRLTKTELNTAIIAALKKEVEELDRNLKELSK